MHVDKAHAGWAFVSTQPASRRETRWATGAALASLAVFLAAVPFADKTLPQVPVFIPIYVSSLVIFDIITAVLLFGQYSVLRSTALLALASGYLFSASITGAYALVFPGMFSPTGLFGAGSQTTSLLYMVWHSGFALFVMAYARMRPAGIDAAAYGTARRKSARDGIARAVLAVLAMVLGITLFATVGERHIPEFIQGDRTTDLGHGVLAGVWLFSLLALWLLWRKRPHVVLDVWLMVVLCVWLFDIALAAMLNSGRYDVGWYVGRIYGLLSAGFLLLALLLEDSRQSARLVHMSIELDAANRALLELSRHDGLTSLANRRYFDEYLDEQIALAVRHKRGLALILCDVDHFKSYNDQYGHPAGDECLRRVGAALQSCCQRPADMAARYGGEEFALILPDTGTIGAAQVAEAVRTAIVAMNITHSASSTGPCVSVSGGVAILRVNAQNGASQLISDADKGMYMAKTQGRNRMHIQTA